MELDKDKIDEDVLALLYLTAFRHSEDEPFRAWKGHDWDVLGRLYGKGLVSDPVSKSKSVMFTDAGFLKAKALFEAKYAKS